MSLGFSASGGGSSGGSATVTSVVTVSQLTANTNNLAIAFNAPIVVAKLSSDALRNLTGVVAGNDGQILILVGTGSNDINIIDSSANSDAANRFLGDFGDTTIGPVSSPTTLVYDTTESRWRVIAPV